MAEMLTAKEMQTLLQVDRSTIYRMAEAGRLPAVRVGKQWRFPGSQVESWLQNRTNPSGPSGIIEIDSPNCSLAEILPLECVQVVQDAFAETLEVMFIVTDLAGRPITQASQPCLVYTLLSETEAGRSLLQEKWRELGQVPALEPRFVPCLGELLCARALVRLGNELKGMVIACGVVPQDWSPSTSVTAELAQACQVPLPQLQSAFDTVVKLSPLTQKKVLLTTQRIADILAHITAERYDLLERLSSIARLSAL